MADVDSGLADWLKSAELVTTAQPTGAVGWGDRAIDVSISTPIAARADAVAEGGRVVGFLAGPNVRDRLVVPGRRKDLLGRALTLKSRAASALGYEGPGAVVFVLGFTENDNGTTTLIVLRRLSG